jgi:hypothetical protein
MSLPPLILYLDTQDFKGIPVSDELIDSGVISRFMKGHCSDAEFEERINRWITDPAEYSRIVYDYADNPNMIDEFFREGVDRMEAAFHEIQDIHKAHDKIGEQLRSAKLPLAALAHHQPMAKA